MFERLSKAMLVVAGVSCLLVPSQAIAGPNTIASSTMQFEGALTDAGGGVYTGTIAATPGAYYVVGGAGESIATNGGFDVYAKDGGCAFVQGYYGIGSFNCSGADTFLVPAAGEMHDAYPSAVGGGPWGSFYNPDVEDYYNYELTLTATNWYLRYNGNVLGNGNATPMSGAMNWTALYASEDDVGAYVAPPADPDSNDGDAAAHGAGAGWWDMDWTWGSDAVPLELPGFDVLVEDLGGGDYRVTLTPAAPPAVPMSSSWGLGALALLLAAGLCIAVWRLT